MNSSLDQDNQQIYQYTSFHNFLNGVRGERTLSFGHRCLYELIIFYWSPVIIQINKL